MRKSKILTLAVNGKNSDLYIVQEYDVFQQFAAVWSVMAHVIECIFVAVESLFNVGQESAWHSRYT